MKKSKKEGFTKNQKKNENFQEKSLFLFAFLPLKTIQDHLVTLSSVFSKVLTPNTSISGHRDVVEMLCEVF